MPRYLKTTINLELIDGQRLRFWLPEKILGQKVKVHRYYNDLSEYRHGLGWRTAGNGQVETEDGNSYQEFGIVWDSRYYCFKIRFRKVPDEILLKSHHQTA